MRHKSRALAALAVLVFLGAAVVGGCGGATAGQPASPSPSAPPPSTPADITGTVRDLSAGTGGDSLPVLLVVADPGTTSSVDRASVSVTADTVVWTAEGARGRPADLAEGQQVGVWFTGPVRESYPVQATAGVVMVLLYD
jgi:hypothetical protein